MSFCLPACTHFNAEKQSPVPAAPSLYNTYIYTLKDGHALAMTGFNSQLSLLSSIQNHVWRHGAASQLCSRCQCADVYPAAPALINMSTFTC